MHDCLNDQPARTVCKVAQSEIYACLADARARAARLIQPARRAPLNAGIKSFPTRDRRPSETEIQIAQKSPNMHSQKMGAGPCILRPFPYRYITIYTCTVYNVVLEHHTVHFSVSCTGIAVRSGSLLVQLWPCVSVCVQIRTSGACSQIYE